MSRHRLENATSSSSSSFKILVLFLFQYPSKDIFVLDQTPPLLLRGVYK